MKFLIKNKSRLILLLILLLAGSFRLWNLGDLPQGFHNDEVMNGYVGRYILENGVDLYGNRWPILYFDNFGDYPNVIPMYLSGLGALVFGSSVFAVRLPIALMGVLAVFILYLLAKWLFKQEWLALLSAFFLSILPWHLVLSRATAEGITAGFVFIAGLLMVFESLKRKSWVMFGISGLVLLSTYLLYPGFRVVVPLAMLPAPLLVRKKQWRLAVASLVGLFFVLTILISQTIWGRGRYEQTSLFSHNNVIGGRAVNYSVGLGEGRVLEAKIFHNKYLLAGREFARQYTSYFSPDYLFGTGGEPMRYYVPEHGLLVWSFALLGVLFLIRVIAKPINKEELTRLFKQGREEYFVWLVWILAVSPVPAALTLDEVPNIHRTAVMAILFCLFASVAVYFVAGWHKKWKNIFLIVLMLGISLEAIHFWHYYRGLHSVASVAYRKDEQRVLSEWLIENHSNYDFVFVPGNEVIALHYLFRSDKYPAELAGTFKQGITVDQIDNIIFSDLSCASNDDRASTASGKIAVVDRSECDVDQKFNLVTRLSRFDLSDAYRVSVPLGLE